MKVCDLETAQELDKLCKDKGIEMPESAFYWRRPSVVLPHELKYGKPNAHNLDVIPAYTLDEVLEWLPTVIFGDKGSAYHWKQTIQGFKYVKISGNGPDTLKGSIHGIYHPATAACMLAIWLIKEGYLTK